MEINQPHIYDKPISGKVILRVDTLECLRGIFGDSCFIYRDSLYNLLSGNSTDINRVFASYYRRYVGLTNYVNNEFSFGDDESPLLNRVIESLRDKIDSYRNDVFELLNNRGGKYLVTTHDYIYFAFKDTAKLPEIKGVFIIC